MKQAGALISCVLFLAFTVSAQQSVANFPETAPGEMVASALPPAFASAVLVPAEAIPGEFPSSANSSLPQVTVQSVFPNYNFQLYGGYTFVRFYAFPARVVNRNGFDIGLSYYLHSGHLGIEGSLTTTFGSVIGEQSDFVFAGGGPRLRWALPRGIEIWGHGLVGGANFGPTIAGFGQSTIAYELGGGVDVNAHRQRLAYRFEADMVGTRLYGGAQYSPKFTAGIAFKF